MPPSPKRPVVSLTRLLRRSTLQDHVTVDRLSAPLHDQQTIELIKLRRSFGDFLASTENGDESMTTTNPDGHDIFVSLPRVELVEFLPNQSGWFAVFLIDKTAMAAVESFVKTTRRHYRETNMFGGVATPFSEPLKNEDAHSRFHIKIAECGGKLLNSTFYKADGEIAFKPGDDLLLALSQLELGHCALTIHMAGYWYDSTKQGPLIFLSTLRASNRDGDEGSDAATPEITEMLKSPGGSVTRRCRQFLYGEASPELDLVLQPPKQNANFRVEDHAAADNSKGRVECSTSISPRVEHP